MLCLRGIAKMTKILKCYNQNALAPAVLFICDCFFATFVIYSFIYLFIYSFTYIFEL